MRLPNPRLPNPRGPVSDWLVDALERRPHPFKIVLPAYLDDEDLQIALLTCLELGDLGVNPGWAGHPSVVSLRTRLADVSAQRAAELPTGPSTALVDHLHREATLEQFQEFAMHRSVMHPHERRLLTMLGLDPTPGAYLDDAPAVTVALRNATTISRTVRTHPSTTHPRIAEGLRRLGFTVPVPDPVAPAPREAAPTAGLHRAFSEHLVDQWSWHSSSLRTPAFVL